MNSNKRNLIIEEAMKIIALEGLENFSLSHLSSRVGITKATLYNYFKSKDEIIDEILSSGHKALMKNGFTLKLNGSVYNILLSFITHWRDILLSDENILFLRIIFSSHLINKRAQEEYRSIMLMLKSQSSVVASSFSLTPGFETTLSSFLEALLLEWLWKILEGEDIPIEEECERLETLIEYLQKKAK